jgi:hypothetical protein
MFIRHKQDTENCIWVDCCLTSGIYCLFKDFFGHVHHCADFVSLQVFTFAVIYDVLCQGDTSAFVKKKCWVIV